MVTKPETALVRFQYLPTHNGKAYCTLNNPVLHT